LIRGGVDSSIEGENKGRNELFPFGGGGVFGGECGADVAGEGLVGFLHLHIADRVEWRGERGVNAQGGIERGLEAVAEFLAVVRSDS